MTVDQMLLLSRFSLVLMIVMTVLAVFIFFKMDVRKAWWILKGRKLPPRQQHKQQDLRHNAVRPSLDMATTQLLQGRGDINNQDKGSDVTTVLQNMQETELLADTRANDNRDNMVLDITFIHTQTVLE